MRTSDDIVNPDLPQLRLLQHPREHVANVSLFECGAFERGQHSRRNGLALLDPPFPLPAAPREERLEGRKAAIRNCRLAFIDPLRPWTISATAPADSSKPQRVP